MSDDAGSSLLWNLTCRVCSDKDQVSSNRTKSKFMRRLCKNSLRITAGLVGLSFLTPGCSSAPKPSKPVQWSVNISKVTPASIEVDLVGISRSEDAYWRSIKPSDYWKPNSKLRKEVQDRCFKIKFESPDKSSLSKDDPMWNKWFGYGAFELMVIAELPGKDFDDGPADPRRLFLNLGKKQWQAKNMVIELEVSDGQVRVLTPQNP